MPRPRNPWFRVYRPEAGLRCGQESPPPPTRLEAVGGLTSGRRKSGVPPLAPPPHLAPLGASVRMLSGRPARACRPRPRPRGGRRALTHARRPSAAQVRLRRVFRAEALADFLPQLPAHPEDVRRSAGWWSLHWGAEVRRAAHVTCRGLEAAV